MFRESRATFLTSRTPASKRPSRRRPPGSRRLSLRPYARNLAQAPVAMPIGRKPISLSSEFRQLHMSAPVAVIVWFASVGRHRRLNRPDLKAVRRHRKTSSATLRITAAETRIPILPHFNMWGATGLLQDPPHPVEPPAEAITCG